MDIEPVPPQPFAAFLNANRETDIPRLPAAEAAPPLTQSGISPPSAGAIHSALPPMQTRVALPIERLRQGAEHSLAEPGLYLTERPSDPLSLASRGTLLTLRPVLALHTYSPSVSESGPPSSMPRNTALSQPPASRIIPITPFLQPSVIDQQIPGSPLNNLRLRAPRAPTPASESPASRITPVTPLPQPSVSVQRTPGSTLNDLRPHAPRTPMPASQSSSAIPATEPFSSQPTVGNAQAGGAGGQTHSLPPSRKILNPQEALARLQGRSDGPSASNNEAGLGTKISTMGPSNSMAYSFHIHGVLTFFLAPYHRQMDVLPPISPPARLPPRKGVNPFAKLAVKPKKG